MTTQLTRDQAIAIVGGKYVCRAEDANCDYTGTCRDDGLTEFAAHAEGFDQDGIPVTVSAYYYQDAQAAKDAESLDSLNWVIDHYRIA